MLAQHFVILEGEWASTVEFSPRYFFHQKSVVPGRREATAYYLTWTLPCFQRSNACAASSPLLYSSEFLWHSTGVNGVKAAKYTGMNMFLRSGFKHERSTRSMCSYQLNWKLVPCTISHTFFRTYDQLFCYVIICLAVLEFSDVQNQFLVMKGLN